MILTGRHNFLHPPCTSLIVAWVSRPEPFVGMLAEIAEMHGYDTFHDLTHYNYSII